VLKFASRLWPIGCGSSALGSIQDVQLEGDSWRDDMYQMVGVVIEAEAWEWRGG
jgi:hypothetical protein